MHRPLAGGRVVQRMSLVQKLGRSVSLRIHHFAPPGAYLAVEAVDPRHDPEFVLLPNAELTDDMQEDDLLNVFLYMDSEDRPIATLREPYMQLGEVRFLEVHSITRIGAFFGWGLVKDLYVPFREQTVDLEEGDIHAIGLRLDETQRLSGTMRVAELLKEGGGFERDQWVAGESWRKVPGTGVFVILERRWIGLLPEEEPHTLHRGQAAKFRIARVHPDGKLVLSLRAIAKDQMDEDAQRVLAKLQSPNAPRIGDKSSPERIKLVFGLSKKAFKRATGRLLKKGDVRLDQDGMVVLNNNPEQKQ
jgi:uncharacterized protein